jgi:Tfp pilus assembly protein PilP
VWGLSARRVQGNGLLILMACLAGLFFTGTEAWAAKQMVHNASRDLKNTSLATGKPEESAGDRAASKPGEENVDPFKSFLSLQEEANEKKRKERPKTYLETLDLSQLDLIATILDRKGNWAMVRDSKGVGHVIRKGTRIGTNDGVVREIREGAVVVREKHTDFMGKVETKDVVKKMSTRK